MMRFAQSRIIPFLARPDAFAASIAEQFDLLPGQMEWASDKPKQPENVLVRHATPKRGIVSRLWRPFRFIDLFAGIGGMRLGFEAVGGQCVFSSEWDPLAQETYKANFDEKPEGDITQINAVDIPNHDILLAGFPCQPFSIIGKREGFTDTRGTLFFEIERILREKKPTAFLLENVKQFKTHDNGNTCRIVLNKLHELGYYTRVAVLNALNFGVAQKREIFKKHIANCNLSGAVCNPGFYGV